MDALLTNEMKIAKAVEEIQEQEFYASLREDYSGRGMYGATCYGAVVSDVNEFIRIAKKHGIKETPKVDNMGKNYIVYYPTITKD